MLVRSIFPFLGLMVFLAVFGPPQQKEIRHVPATPASSVSGKEMYKVYCAVCHGAGSKGNGPAAEALKIPPSELTTLGRKNGGTDPSDHVRGAIEGNPYISAHGSRQCLFGAMSSGA